MSLQSTTPFTNQSSLVSLILFAIQGSIIHQQSAVISTGVITSYTPASGKRFILLRYFFNVIVDSSEFQPQVLIRNNGTIVDSLWVPVSRQESEMMAGDILIGTGIVTYDIFCNGLSQSFEVVGGFKGVIV
ncbi:MAG: hypothetical protein KGI08_07290 [Thaumarchaeota archaeon]|nr:hypothetical protein [Nitrososphaerota archaeon]